jgi:CRP-like cAMP-binding protein
MFNSFKEYIHDKAKLTNEELEKIKSFSSEKRLRKKQYLLQEGEVNKYATFIVKGCLRTYRVSDDGSEHILSFGIENWWVGDLESKTTGLPSKSNIEALEDSQLLIWPINDFDFLIDTIPELKSFNEKAFQRSLAAFNNRVYNVIGHSAEEKYREFIKINPDIFNRVPLHMIASYLGVSRKTLSRIRSQDAYK